MYSALSVGPFVDLGLGGGGAEQEKSDENGEAHGDGSRFSLLWLRQIMRNSQVKQGEAGHGLCASLDDASNPK
jgi:hypothetical protein